MFVYGYEKRLSAGHQSLKLQEKFTRSYHDCICTNNGVDEVCDVFKSVEGAVWLMVAVNRLPPSPSLFAVPSFSMLNKEKRPATVCLLLKNNFLHEKLLFFCGHFFYFVKRHCLRD